MAHPRYTVREAGSEGAADVAELYRDGALVGRFLVLSTGLGRASVRADGDSARHHISRDHLLTGRPWVCGCGQECDPLIAARSLFRLRAVKRQSAMRYERGL